MKHDYEGIPQVEDGVACDERPELRQAADSVIRAACAAIRERWPRNPVGYQLIEADTPRCAVPRNRFGTPLI